MILRKSHFTNRGLTLPEVLVSVAILSLITAVLASMAITTQKNFAASLHYSNGQNHQLRILDSISRDLRMALTVSITENGIILELPEFFDADGDEILPHFESGKAIYGSLTNGPLVTYAQDGDRVTRTINHRNRNEIITTVMATDVEDFLSIYETIQQSVRVEIRFPPRFRWFPSNDGANTESTLISITTLRRNE